MFHIVLQFLNLSLFWKDPLSHDSTNLFLLSATVSIIKTLQLCFIAQLLVGFSSKKTNKHFFVSVTFLLRFALFFSDPIALWCYFIFKWFD